jgi:hypothetical protein
VGDAMNAIEMALEALENPSTIAVQYAIDLLRQIKHPFIYFHPDSLQTSTFMQDGYIALYQIDGADYE